ncbi:hypothetical protein [Paenibacillus herberti]|uniref:DNA polymerase IV n=1 Tax=Paenibacillus herberti TaxID=1619309 RepID=A0A229P4Z1_9BACL|nr:hypothetical protein [Paenibacillus herberti]OXM17332.1 DNA polymerase IV [Paenibacillus herberti]
MFIDFQSLYASMEKAAHPQYKNRPVVVGDPASMDGMVLAVCPMAKERGVLTGWLIREALAKCPELVVIRPRIKAYIEISHLISNILKSYSDQFQPFSIDEQFIDITISANLYDTPEELAHIIQNHIFLSTGVWARIGIGPTKIMAKMAIDNCTKEGPEGVFTLWREMLESTFWTLPVKQLFMVGARMTRHFTQMVLLTIGNIARLELQEFKSRLSIEMGKQSDNLAVYYWQMARGLDPSLVKTDIQESFSQSRALQLQIFRSLADIEAVLLELIIEVSQQMRRHNYRTAVVSISAIETEGDQTGGFSRQIKLSQPTFLIHEIAEIAVKVLRELWNGMPVSRLSVTLSELTDESIVLGTQNKGMDERGHQKTICSRLHHKRGAYYVGRHGAQVAKAVKVSTAEERLMISKYIFLLYLEKMAHKELLELENSSYPLLRVYKMTIYNVLNQFINEIYFLRRELRSRNIRMLSENHSSADIYLRYSCRGYEEHFVMKQEVMHSKIKEQIKHYTEKF